MNWQDFSALVVLATAMSFSPGPNTTLSTALAANGGLGRAMRFVLAVPVGWCLLLLLSAAGIGALVSALPTLRWVVKALGIGYLIWLAYQLAGSGKPAPRNSGDQQPDPQPIHVNFRQGVMLQFVNIKAWFLAMTFAANWVVGHAEALQRLAIVAAVMLIYGFASNFSYALIGALLRNWLAQGHRLLWFNRAMAAILVLTAAWMSRL